MTGSPTPPLTESLKFLKRKVITGQMKETVEKHGTMTRGKNKTIPIGPGGISGVMGKELGPEDNGDIGHTHRHTRMPGICLLNPIHG
jgi:hypothetical protein